MRRPGDGPRREGLYLPGPAQQVARAMLRGASMAKWNGQACATASKTSRGSRGSTGRHWAAYGVHPDASRSASHSRVELVLEASCAVKIVGEDGRPRFNTQAIEPIPLSGRPAERFLFEASTAQPLRNGPPVVALSAASQLNCHHHGAVALIGHSHHVGPSALPN